MLYTLVSRLSSEEYKIPFELSEKFINEHQVVSVLSGGTESMFVDLIKTRKIDLNQPIYLQVSTEHNSLSAGLEMLSYVRQRNGEAKIMQHAKDIVFPDIYDAASLTREPLEHVLRSKEKIRLGVIGESSEWLIASKVDYKEVLKKMNIELVDIPVDRVTSLGGPQMGLEGAEAIYGRLKEIVAEYKLQGLTLRCIDLLKSLQNTGCVALSKLNDDGIPAGCESDIPVLLTLLVCKRLTGEPAFMFNASSIKNDGQITGTHCTVPLKMTERHDYTTEYEDGTGVAIHGDIPAGDYTLVKLSHDLKRLLAVNVTIEESQYDACKTRTQVKIKTTPIVASYFLSNPIANHHVIIRGHHAAKFWRSPEK